MNAQLHLELQPRPPRPTLLDLFSGCGGMSLGFERAGFEPVLAIDHWSDALETYRFNNPGVPTLCEDMMDLDPWPLAKKMGQIDLIIGGPPCQGFSISGKRDPEDPRNALYQNFVDFVDAFRPRMFVMENVPNMASMGKGAILEAAKNEFELLGYRASHAVLLASDFGVPQNRRRLFLVGARDGAPFEFPEPTTQSRRPTTKDGISDLPEHSLRDGSAYPTRAASDFQRAMRADSKGLWNHQTTEHAEKTVRTIALVPDGGNYKDLPEQLQDTRKVNIAWTRYNSQKPSHTIDTGHRHHFHYKWNRIPTVRESARLQSFPDTFIFLGSKTSQYKQVGNAVPPLLAEAIGSAILARIKSTRGS